MSNIEKIELSLTCHLDVIGGGSDDRQHQHALAASSAPLFLALTPRCSLNMIPWKLSVSLECLCCLSQEKLQVYLSSLCGPDLDAPLPPVMKRRGQRGIPRKDRGDCSHQACRSRRAFMRSSLPKRRSEKTNRGQDDTKDEQMFAALHSKQTIELGPNVLC